MAGSFPTLKSGNTVWYPLEETHSFGTGIIRFLDDSEQRWRTRNMLRKFKLVCNDINTYDASLILQFFRSQFGQFDSTWDMTIGSETHENLAFATDSFRMVENRRNRVTMTFDVIQVKSAKPTIPSAGDYFPQIGGITTCLPYTNQFDFRTAVSEMAVGNRYAYKWRSIPLGKFSVVLSGISNADLATVQDFFYAMEGRKGEFTFLDPGGNLVPYSDAFGNASWTKQTLTVGSAQTDPFGGSLAIRLTGSGSNSLLHCTVIPNGDASGYSICGSVWARASASSQQLSIGFVDSGFSVIGNTVWDLPQGVWVRIRHSMALATNSYIRLLIGGFGGWGSGQAIDLFSAQCTPMPGAGPRLLTPGADSLRTKCRFDTDDFVVQRSQFNNNSVTLPIVEYI